MRQEGRLVSGPSARAALPARVSIFRFSMICLASDMAEGDFDYCRTPAAGGAGGAAFAGGAFGGGYFSGVGFGSRYGDGVGLWGFFSGRLGGFGGSAEGRTVVGAVNAFFISDIARFAVAVDAGFAVVFALSGGHGDLSGGEWFGGCRGGFNGGCQRSSGGKAAL